MRRSPFWSRDKSAKNLGYFFDMFKKRVPHDSYSQMGIFNDNRCLCINYNKKYDVLIEYKVPLPKSGGKYNVLGLIQHLNDSY